FATLLTARLRALGKRLVDSERETFLSAAARVERFVASYEAHTATLVLFADASGDLFWTGELRAPVSTDVRWEPTPWVRPLLEALDEHRRYAVVVADKERARVLTVCLGEIEQEHEAIAAAEVRHKNASGTDHWRSQMHFQRQDDMHVRWHLAHVVEVLETVAGTNG